MCGHIAMSGIDYQYTYLHLQEWPLQETGQPWAKQLLQLLCPLFSASSGKYAEYRI
jgi:hypothetical protein